MNARGNALGYGRGGAGVPSPEKEERPQRIPGRCALRASERSRRMGPGVVVS